MAEYEYLIVERHGPVGWLINNRPDALNAMNARMRDEFGAARATLSPGSSARFASKTEIVFVDVLCRETDGVGKDDGFFVAGAEA
jgi:hypothetical protein